jgi:cytidylate kinase
MPIVAISRGTLSGGRALAETLSERLNYRCLSREQMMAAASQQYGVPEFELYEVVQKAPSIMGRLKLRRMRHLAYIQAVLCEHAKDDNLIYHGNCGHFLLVGVAHVLRVRVLADMAYRIKAAMSELKCSERAAKIHIHKVDKQRAKWTKFLYGKDWNAPEWYDILLNAERGGLEFMCAMVEHAIKQPQFQATPSSRKAMDDLLVASRLKAALAGLPGIRLRNIDVQCDGGNVVIQGIAKSPELLEAIGETATTTSGVRSVENLVRVNHRRQEVDL